MTTQVEYSLEVTVNIGDFQNVKPGVRVITDVKDGEKIDDTFARVKSKVDAWMDKELETIKADLPNLPGN